MGKEQDAMMHALTNGRTALVGLCLCLGLAQTAVAEEKKGDIDAKFIKHATSGGMLEAKLGQLAVDQAQSDAVRKFGQRMLDDHGKANKELLAILEKKGITVSKDLMKEHQDAWTKFSKMKGADFDQAYAKHMVKDHEEDVELFENEAKNGKDEDLKAFAAKTLPTIKEHLRMAKVIAGEP